MPRLCLAPPPTAVLSTKTYPQIDITVSGITLSATDSDGDSITHSIISSAGPFKLSGAGTSVLTNGLAIDFETQDSYSLTVQAEATGDYGIYEVIGK